MNPVKPGRRPVFRLELLLLASVVVLILSSPVFAQTNQDWRPPAFTAELADGSKFSYPDHLDGPTIVLFWATWCPYCKALMPHLQSLLDEYPGQLQVLSLAIREDSDPAAVLAEYGYGFALVPEADAVAEAWGVKGVPGLYLAAPDGRIVFDRGRISAPEPNGGPENGSAVKMKHYQKAARNAPRWAAHLRVALDELLDAP